MIRHKRKRLVTMPGQEPLIYRGQHVGHAEVHVAKWQFPNGDVRWAVVAPYDAWFTDTVKAEIPGKARAWIPAAKAWFFDDAYEGVVRKALCKVYGPAAPCAQCWSGERCAAMDAVEAHAAKYNLGAQVRPETEAATPEPEPASEQKPAQPEHPVAAAAKLLEVEWWSPADEIKAAARRRAADAHPDHPGGSHEAMVAVLAARNLLLGGR